MHIGNAAEFDSLEIRIAWNYIYMWNTLVDLIDTSLIPIELIMQGLQVLSAPDCHVQSADNKY